MVELTAPTARTGGIRSRIAPGTRTAAFGLGTKPACLGCRISSAQQERVMNPAALCRTVIATVALGGAALVAGPARTEERLAGFNADIRESSISGISSGAFMAVQFATAWSSVIKGVGVVAGGPYWCAKADADDFINGYTLPIMTATGPCMSGPPSELSNFFAKADAKSASGDIDSLKFVRRQKVYVFHGYKDAA